MLLRMTMNESQHSISQNVKMNFYLAYSFLAHSNVLSWDPAWYSAPQCSWFSHPQESGGIKKPQEIFIPNVKPSSRVMQSGQVSLTQFRKAKQLPAEEWLQECNVHFCSRPRVCPSAASGKEARCLQHLYFPCCGEVGTFTQLKTE